jgi:hypothetical protein
MEDINDILASADNLNGFNFEDLAAYENQKPTNPKRIPPGTAAGIGMKTRTTTTTLRRRFYDLSNVPNAIKLIRPLPERNESIHAIMGGDFAAWDLVPAIIKLAEKAVTKAYIATLGFNTSNSYHLATLITEKTIGQATVVCSDYFAKADATTFREAKTRLEAVGSTLTSTRNHAKILALDMGENCYVVEGSANLRSCNNLEQITISNSRELFNFHAAWISKLTNQC